MWDKPLKLQFFFRLFFHLSFETTRQRCILCFIAWWYERENRHWHIPYCDHQFWSLYAWNRWMTGLLLLMLIYVVVLLHSMCSPFFHLFNVPHWDNLSLFVRVNFSVKFFADLSKLILNPRQNIAHGLGPTSFSYRKMDVSLT